MSTACSREPPSVRNVRSCSTRRSLACVTGVISAISSRKSVPRLASSKQPARRAIAPVNAPFSWPKSSDSSSVSGIAAQLSATNGCDVARAQLMNRLRDELLARAGFAASRAPTRSSARPARSPGRSGASRRCRRSSCRRCRARAADAAAPASRATSRSARRSGRAGSSAAADRRASRRSRRRLA